MANINTYPEITSIVGNEQITLWSPNTGDGLNYISPLNLAQYIVNSQGLISGISNIGTSGIGIFSSEISGIARFNNISANSNKISVTLDGINNLVNIDVIPSNISINSLTSYPLTIDNGGTNAITAPAALTSLGALPLAGGTMTGNLFLNGDPGSPTQAATKNYVDIFASGKTFLNPILDSDLINDSLNTPPVTSTSEVYIAGAAPTGAWTGFAGHAFSFFNSQWNDILDRAVQIGDRFGVLFTISGVPAGGLTGDQDKIAQIVNAIPGSITYTFTTPISSNATYVNNAESARAGFEFTYNGIDWIETGVSAPIITGFALLFSGNILNFTPLSITTLTNLISVGTITTGIWNATAITDSFIATPYIKADGTRALTGSWNAGTFSATFNSVIVGSSANTINGLSTIINSGTLSLPTSTDTLVGKNTTDIFTNKTFNTSATGNVFQINGTGITSVTGSGAVALSTSATLVTPLLGTPTSGILTNCTGLPITTGISGLGAGISVFLSTPTSVNLATAVTDETGSGSLVFATSPTLVTPLLGIPTSGTLTNCTGLPISTGVSGLGAGIATFLATPSSANLATAVTDETGSGSLVFSTSPSFTTPTLGVASATTINKVTITTPATGSTLTIANGKTLTASNTLTFTGTDTSSIAFGDGGTVTYTSNNLSVFSATTSAQLAGIISDETGSGSLVFATSPTFITPLLGIPTSGTLTNCTGLPVSTGISGFGSGIATFLATPSSANLASAVTDETGGAGSLVFSNSPTLTAPILGAASASLLVINAISGNGYLELDVQSSNPSAGPTNSIRLFSNSTGLLSWIKPSDGFVRSFLSTLTASRTYTLPDITGPIQVSYSRAYSSQTLAFSTPRTPNANSDTLVVATLSIVCGANQTGSITIQVNTGAGMTTIGTTTNTTAGAGNQNTQVIPVSFFVPLNASYQFVNSGIATSSITSIFELTQ